MVVAEEIERGQSCPEECNKSTTIASPDFHLRYDRNYSVSPVREPLPSFPGRLLVSLDSRPRHGYVKHASILEESPGVLLDSES